MASPLDRLTNNWQLKLTALVLAFLFWAALRREQPYRYTFPRVPVAIMNEDPDWVLAGPPEPATIRVTLEGPGGELLEIAGKPPEVRIPMNTVSDSAQLRELRHAWVRFGAYPGTRVVSVDPPAVRLSFERLGAKLLPLAVAFSGRPADGFELVGGAVIEPPVVRASGGVGRLARMDSLRLALNLDDRRGIDTLEVAVDTAGTGLVFSPNRVRVIITLRPVADSTFFQELP